MIARETPWLETLTVDECLSRISEAKVGRIGFVSDGTATILPVNFQLSNGSIIFCTNKGSKLGWLSNHSRVAFEVDDIRHGDREGWSVLVHGAAHEVIDPAEIEVLSQGPLPSWLPTAHWVKIEIETISGRAVHAARSHAGDP